MPDYIVFGGRLRSEIPLPELREAEPGPADWTLRSVSRTPPEHELSFLGEVCVDSNVMVRHYRFDGGYRLAYDDTGTFDISGDGTRITWYPAPDAVEDAARLDIMGFVFAAAFHAAGMLCLHGSAVAMPSGGIAFLAPKRHGKSTLARALTKAGARLATDDSLPVNVGPPPLMYPGVHQLRLWDDSATRIDGDGTPYRNGYGGKNVLIDFDPEVLVGEPVPLSGVYLLIPVRPEPGVPPARRIPLSPLEATLALVTHAKLGGMLGRSEAPTVLDRAARLAANTPVSRLEVVRDFDRLDDVVDEVLAWHGGVADPVRKGSH